MKPLLKFKRKHRMVRFGYILEFLQRFTWLGRFVNKILLTLGTFLCNVWLEHTSGLFLSIEHTTKKLDINITCKCICLVSGRRNKKKSHKSQRITRYVTGCDVYFAFGFVFFRFNFFKFVPNECTCLSRSF